eukprot:15076154-Heterocapsa_arctica.AAC.1
MEANNVSGGTGIPWTYGGPGGPSLAACLAGRGFAFSYRAEVCRGPTSTQHAVRCRCGEPKPSARGVLQAQPSSGSFQKSSIV